MGWSAVESLYSNLKNSVCLRKNSVVINYSRLNYSILKKLLVLGYVSRITLMTDSRCLRLRVLLMVDQNSVLPITGMKLFSSSSTRNATFTYRQLCRSQGCAAGVLLLSTKFGILTRSEALVKGVGGLPLLSVW